MKYSLFTKYWKDQPVEELAEIVCSLGFENIELPVRDGFLVEPTQAVETLPKVAKMLKSCGVTVTSVTGMAGLCDESLIMACAEAEVPLIRACIPIEESGYFATVDKTKKGLAKMQPLLEKANVKFGIQNHSYRSLGSALAVWDVVREFDPAHIAAVWDPAHCALAGELPEYAYEILKSRLAMVNLKNAYWIEKGTSEQGNTKWDVFWDIGRKGLASWPKVAGILKTNDYDGLLCIFAEYTEEKRTEEYAREDIQFAKALFER